MTLVCIQYWTAVQKNIDSHGFLNVDHAKKLKTDDQGTSSSKENTSNQVDDDTAALAATITKKDRKKFYKAVRQGQKFNIVDGKLVRRTFTETVMDSYLYYLDPLPKDWY